MRPFQLIAYAVLSSVLPAVATSQSRPSEPLPPTYVRVYDVHDLIAPVQNFPLATSPYAQAFLSPSGAPHSQLYNETAQSGAVSQLFPQRPRTSESTEKAEQATMDELVKLILDNIDTETWKDMGGRIGMLHVFHGMLVVTQTKEAHQRIVQLLDDLAHDQAAMVHVHADWLLLSSSDAAKLTKASSREGVPIVDPAVLENPPAGAKHFAAQTLSRSGQTVYAISGLDRSMVTSATPVVSTGVAAYSADVSNVGGGIALEVNSRVNSQQGTASVTLYSAFSDPAQPSRDSSITITSIATTQPAGSGQVTQLPITSGLQPFSRVVQDMRTTVRIPLGVPVVVGGMTLQPDTKGGDEQQLLLILKVTASK